jgi:DNA modification methylase
MSDAKPSILFYGDNLDVLRRHVADESVDLVYLDPPFSSNADYNVLFREHDEGAAAQVQAFTDTWEWNLDARAAYEAMVEQGGPVAETMRAFRTMVGPVDMLAYLSMMAPRLVELHRVLKPTGSIYLHCDPTASHYLKLLMDATFGASGFQNEVIWHYRGGGISKGRWGRRHDVLLFYTKGPSHTFNVDEVRDAYSKESLDRLKYKAKSFRGDKVYDSYEPNPLGKHPDDVWDMQPIMPSAKERLGYPTQKPLALLDRIIKSSSNPGDLVLDPFCGCGTTVDAAQALGRRWIGVDITHLSIGLIKHRLADRYGPEITETYRVVGEPTTVDDAAVLAREDPFQFQAWALGLVGARIAGSDKKGGDKGIDGRLYFHEGASETRQIVFSVKAGHLVPAFIRDLSGVLTREGAQIGVLISFEEPSAGMRSEAAEAGFYESPWGKHPRIQLRTIRELLDNRGIDYPHVQGANVTHRRAGRAIGETPENLSLFDTPPASTATDDEDAE